MIDKCIVIHDFFLTDHVKQKLVEPRPKSIGEYANSMTGYIYIYMLIFFEKPD